MRINTNALTPDVTLQNTRLELRANVTDEEVRRTINSDFNGYEKVFALVPRRENGQVVWDRRELGYSYGYGDRAGGTHDTHSLSLDVRSIDFAAVVDYGIAFGMEIEDRKNQKQTVWAQTIGDNFKVL